MTPLHRIARTRRRPSRVLAATSAAALLFVAAACGDDDDDDAATTTTTTTTEAVEEETTTSAPEDEQTDDANDGDAEAALLALLPDVAAMAPDYTEVPDTGADDSEDNTAVEAAMEEACPEAAALMAEDDDEDDTAEREYQGSLERSVTVGLDPSPRNMDEDTIDDAVAAIASCETITLTQDGFDATIDLTAERDDTYGDRGVLMTMDLSMAHPQLPTPITLEMRGRFFQVRDLGAEVSVMSGFDETTFEPASGDFDLLDALAAELEAAAASHES